jgi:soluble lytic murein transglycosylase-like protein
MQSTQTARVRATGARRWGVSVGLAFAVSGLVGEAGSASVKGLKDTIQARMGADGVLELTSRAKPRRAAGARSLPVAMPQPDRNVSAAAASYDPYILEAARLYHIPEALIRAVIQVESNFDPRAVSPANAHGLMQMIPETAERMMVTDAFDPRQNILGGTRYLRILANTFNGDLHLTLAGYNAGEGAVAKYRGIPPYPETQDYVARVLDAYRRYQDRVGLSSVRSRAGAADR